MLGAEKGTATYRRKVDSPHSKLNQTTFKLPCHKLKKDVQTKLEDLLKEYQSQFGQDETTIGTTPLTKMTIDTGNSEPVSQKNLSNHNETLQKG